MTLALGVAGVRASEFFGAQHGDDEVDEEAEGDEADDNVFPFKTVFFSKW